MRNVLILLLLSSLSMNGFSTDSKEQEFWNWFSSNEKEIFSFEENKENVLDSISNALSKYEDGLGFEISHVTNGKREFIITADGISELFPGVELLAQAAPNLDRWIIIPFRQRQDNYENFKIEYAGKEADPSKIWVYYRIEDGNFDLIVYHPEYSEAERNVFVAASYLLLDMALGEYDVVNSVRYIDHQRVPENPVDLGLKPFSELRSIFDIYKREYKNN